ncbi:hypothetical protein Droror1_Dr00014159 [Drosera rotundifolia]
MITKRTCEHSFKLAQPLPWWRLSFRLPFPHSLLISHFSAQCTSSIHIYQFHNNKELEKHTQIIINKHQHISQPTSSALFNKQNKLIYYLNKVPVLDMVD